MSWTTKVKKWCLAQAPVGSAPAAQFIDWLIGYGVEEIISTGTCGVLTDIEENAFLVPVRACVMKVTTLPLCATYSIIWMYM